MPEISENVAKWKGFRWRRYGLRNAKRVATSTLRRVARRGVASLGKARAR
jgi:hypothetical protein